MSEADLEACRTRLGQGAGPEEWREVLVAFGRAGRLPEGMELVLASLGTRPLEPDTFAAIRTGSRVPPAAAFLFDAGSGERLAEVLGTENPSLCWWLADGARIALAPEARQVSRSPGLDIRDEETGELLVSVEASLLREEDAAFGAGLLAVRGDGGDHEVHDLATGDFLRCLSSSGRHRGRIHVLSLEDGVLRVLEREDGSVLQEVVVPHEPHYFGLFQARQVPGTEDLLLGMGGLPVQRVDLASGRVETLLERTYNGGLAVSPDGKLLASLDDFGCVEVLHLDSREVRSRYPVPGEIARSLAFTPDGAALAYAQERRVRLLDLSVRRH